MKTITYIIWIIPIFVIGQQEWPYDGDAFRYTDDSLLYNYSIHNIKNINTYNNESVIFVEDTNISENYYNLLSNTNVRLLVIKNNNLNFNKFPVCKNIKGLSIFSIDSIKLKKLLPLFPNLKYLEIKNYENKKFINIYDYTEHVERIDVYKFNYNSSRYDIISLPNEILNNSNLHYLFGSYYIDNINKQFNNIKQIDCSTFLNYPNNFPMIEALSISDQYDSTTINAYDLYYIESILIENIAKNLPNLKYINIRYLTPNILNNFIANLPSLEVLHAKFWTLPQLDTMMMIPQCLYFDQKCETEYISKWNEIVYNYFCNNDKFILPLYFNSKNSIRIFNIDKILDSNNLILRYSLNTKKMEKEERKNFKRIINLENINNYPNIQININNYGEYKVKVIIDRKYLNKVIINGEHKFVRSRPTSFLRVDEYH